MSDDFDDLAVAPSEATNKSFTAAIVAGLVGAIGLFFFVKDWAYFEAGQMLLIVVFIVLAAGVFFSLRSVRTGTAILLIMLAIVTIFFSQQKYAWRKAYMLSAKSGNPFIFEPYIDSYPSYEQYILAPILKRPDWVRYERECAEPLAQDLKPPASCKSLTQIKAVYNIDMNKVMQDYRARMSQTAKRVQKGQIKKKNQYQACIATKQCAEIPLLPPDVDADKIDPNSTDYLEVRRPFWQLINNNDISPEICNFMTLCRILLQSGAMDYNE